MDAETKIEIIKKLFAQAKEGYVKDGNFIREYDSIDFMMDLEKVLDK